jgi:bifunctional non-homologous end joining protein LigD
MLARSGQLPTRGDWAYEVKWDGFRAIVSTEGEALRVRSRRGWDMTDLVPELAALPVLVTLDGELCAFGPDGAPDFSLICERMLMRRSGIRLTYMVFDLLCLDGQDFTRRPYAERRVQLEALGLNDVYWQTPEAFDDGQALRTSSRASSRSDRTVDTAQENAAGSRPRTGTTGATNSSASRLSISRA